MNVTTAIAAQVVASAVSLNCLMGTASVAGDRGSGAETLVRLSLAIRFSAIIDFFNEGRCDAGLRCVGFTLWANSLRMRARRMRRIIIRRTDGNARET